MSKTSAKANPVNKSVGNHNKGSEPGQEQMPPRHDRQNTGNAGGTDTSAKNQGRQRRGGQSRSRSR